MSKDKDLIARLRQAHSCITYDDHCGICNEPYPKECRARQALFKEAADALEAYAAAGLTPKKIKPPTDLTGKCGSCVYAGSTEAFGGSKCYIECKHPEKKWRSRMAHAKQRTTPSCKRYKAKEEKE